MSLMQIIVRSIGYAQGSHISHCGSSLITCARVAAARAKNDAPLKIAPIHLLLILCIARFGFHSVALTIRKYATNYFYLLPSGIILISIQRMLWFSVTHPFIFSETAGWRSIPKFGWKRLVWLVGI